MFLINKHFINCCKTPYMQAEGGTAMSNDVFRTPYSSSAGTMKNSLLSDRDQNLPLEACIGELIDNAFEWQAKNVWIEYEALTNDGWGRAKKLAILDDGLGMDPVKIVDHLTVGFHSAYGGEDSKDSVSKYGVGAKYAFFNTCRRSQVWSKVSGGEWHKAEFNFDDPYLDKTEQEWRNDHAKGRGNGYPKIAIKQSPPAEFERLWGRLDSGTFIQWSVFDKKSAEVNGDEQLVWWLQRAFRDYIGDEIVRGVPVDDGARIERKVIDNPNQRNIIFNDNALEAYDPLYAIPFRNGDGPDDHMGMEVPESLIFPFPIDDPVWIKRLGSRVAPIIVHFGLAPRAWRLKSGPVWERPTLSANLTENIVGRRIQGGSTQYGGSSFWDSRELVSLMRAGREVGKLTDHHLLGKRRDDTDRWMSITIEFGPELDTAFNVRNIKYQVKPTREVRTKIREEIKATVSSMDTEIADWFKRQRSAEEARIAEEERQKNRKKPPIGGTTLKTPSGTEDWASENSDTVGDLPDDPSQDSAEDLIEKLFGSLTGFNRNEVLKEMAKRKLTIEKDLKTQVPGDTQKMFEYRTSGGNVLQVKYQNHPYYTGLQSRYNKLMEIGEELSKLLEDEDSDKEEVINLLNQITLFVKELEEIRDFGMNAAVIALARQSPKGEAVSFRNIFLREWGMICMQMMESKFENTEE